VRNFSRAQRSLLRVSLLSGGGSFVGHVLSSAAVDRSARSACPEYPQNLAASEKLCLAARRHHRNPTGGPGQ
jgi:hypothetical protein